jgi:hypothetical protein
MTILVPPVNERTSRAAKASAAKTMRNAAHASGIGLLRAFTLKMHRRLQARDKASPSSTALAAHLMVNRSFAAPGFNTSVVNRSAPELFPALISAQTG